MTKLYNGKGKRVHPSLPAATPWDFLAALPAAVLTLAAALSPEEREVLAYLLSDGGTGLAGPERGAGKKKPLQSPQPRQQSHPPELGCGCFGCYKSYWARWDASPNRHLIHHILDAFEESLETQPLSSRHRRRRRSRQKDAAGEIHPAVVAGAVELRSKADGDGNKASSDDGRGGEEDETESCGVVVDSNGDGRSSVSKLVSFIGETVWGAWNF